MIQPHTTWSIIDSTKLKTFMSCPRKYFWQYVAGWRPDGESVHLVFGAAWHIAMEHLLLKYKDRGRYDNADIPEAFNLFLNSYRETFPEDMDEVNAPKSPAFALDALALYVNRFGTDSFKVLATEIAGTVPVSEGRRMHFKIDALCQDESGKLFILEHKTSSMMSGNWADQWVLSIQVGTYIHALMCLKDPNLVYGAKVSGTFLRKTKGADFLRVPIKKTPTDMQGWLNMANHYIDMIQNEHEELWKANEDDQVLDAFPMNTESCLNYGRCPYHDLCCATCNPLHMASQPPQTGFKLDFWNPMEEFRKTAKEIVEIGKDDGTDAPEA